MRIASLIPSGTDVVASLGLGDDLVAVSHECDHAIARGKPVVTASNLPHSASPSEIDALVTASVASGTSLYRVARERLEELAPDVVLSQSVCDVCAVSERDARCDLPAASRLVLLRASDVAGLFADVARVGAATGSERRAAEVVLAVEERLARVREAVARRPPVRTLLLEWGDPPFNGGHWVPELLLRAGGENVCGARPGVPSVKIDWSAIRAADPDAIVFLPCGYSLAAATKEARALVAAGGPAAGLRAVRDGRFFATDATRLFSRCTPEAVSRGAEVLAGLLHPDAAAPPDAAEAAAITVGAAS